MSGSPGLSPGQIPALGSQATGASDRSYYGNPSDGSGTVADVHIRVNSPRLTRVSLRKFSPVDTTLMQITN